MSSSLVKPVLFTGIALCAVAAYVHFNNKHNNPQQRQNSKSSNNTKDQQQPQQPQQEKNNNTSTIPAPAQQAFQEAANTVASSTTLQQGDKLMLYGLYKQATIGDIPPNTAIPSKLNVVAHYKYEAWKKFAGMPMEIAMLQYITVVKELVANAGSTGIRSENDDIVYENDNGEEDTDDDEEGGNGNNSSSGGDDPYEGSSILGLGMVRPSSLANAVVEDEEGSSNTNTSLSTLEARLLQVANNPPNSVSCDAIRQLIQDGVDVNTADETGQTALHFAADKGAIDCAKLLVQAGANVNATDREGISALQAAVIMGHLDVTAMLLEAGADPDVKDLDGDSARSCAVVDGSKEMQALFIVDGDNDRVNVIVPAVLDDDDDDDDDASPVATSTSVSASESTSPDSKAGNEAPNNNNSDENVAVVSDAPSKIQLQVTKPKDRATAEIVRDGDRLSFHDKLNMFQSMIVTDKLSDKEEQESGVAISDDVSGGKEVMQAGESDKGEEETTDIVSPEPVEDELHASSDVVVGGDTMDDGKEEQTNVVSPDDSAEDKLCANSGNDATQTSRRWADMIESSSEEEEEEEEEEDEHLNEPVIREEEMVRAQLNDGFVSDVTPNGMSNKPTNVDRESGDAVDVGNGFSIEDDESSEDEEPEEEPAETSATTEALLKATNPEPRPRAMTKKEKQELKAKEMDDLDALLTEFGVKEEKTPADSDAKENVKVLPDPSSNGTEVSNKKKRRNRKKKSDNSDVIEVHSGGTGDADATASTELVKDVAAVLKAKAKPKQKTAAQIAAATAAREMKKSKQQESKKKNKKKSTSYGR